LTKRIRVLFERQGFDFHGKHGCPHSGLTLESQVFDFEQRTHECAYIIFSLSALACPLLGEAKSISVTITSIANCCCRVVLQASRSSVIVMKQRRCCEHNAFGFRNN